MLLGNYNQWNANPGRAIGGPTDPTLKFKVGSHRNFFFQDDATNSAQIRKAATPTGYRHPYAYVMPIDSGGIASINTILCTSDITGANLAGGVNGAAAITATGAFTATMQLIVSAVATIATTCTVTGDINAIAPLAASITAGGTMTSAIKALANAVAAITAGATLTGTPKAIGNMEAAIVPYTELSPEALAASVWNSVAASYNDAGTMGEKLNLAGSGGVDYAALKTAIWEAVLTDYDTDPTSAAAVMGIIQRVLGLDASNPVTTTPTAITAGDLTIAVTGDGETSTTLTRQ